MVMVVEAAYADARGAANALKMSLAEWRHLQATYRVGELAMPCCGAPAIPKISANGHPFFAHAGGSCSTSEESQWHLAAKMLVRTELERLGCHASLEEPGRGAGGRWQADVWGERGDVRLAVEIQRSYQGLVDYRERQARYEAANVRCLWLLRDDRYSTLIRSMGKERLRMEFGGKFPPCGGISPCLPYIPVAQLHFEPEPHVTGAAFFRAQVGELLEAALTDRFLWIDGKWCIDNLDAMDAAMRAARERNSVLNAATASQRATRRRRPV